VSNEITESQGKREEAARCALYQQEAEKSIGTPRRRTAVVDWAKPAVLRVSALRRLLSITVRRLSRPMFRKVDMPHHCARNDEYADNRQKV
jgi:hypothetical protein